MVMGTGLSRITEHLTDRQEIPYADIPHFPQSTVQSHKGRLVMGQLDKCPILIMAGRWHYYEGYSTAEITFPIRVLKTLGVETVILTNASGGVSPSIKAGELVVIKDHINLIPDHPLRGYNDDRIGPRFPDMMHTYDEGWRKKILDAAQSLGVKLKEGVYVALQGPSLETPAEYEFVYRIGGDMVGMSTVPEAIVAKHCGLKILGISIVTNECYPPERLSETTVEEVIEVASKASDDLIELLKKLLN